ncbi:AAA family ATPase [Streptococcus agalactiae]|uniref:AAA family ATPase n=1 Tax=Streptococcus agalactiae TaxID=1311 RepID=UPI00077C5446|nr:AAA family ATPase [Streptococcus agalactiae]
METRPLHVSLRPQTFDEIIGHDAVVKDVQNQLDNNNQRCYLFMGPAGCGKTTFGNVIARHVESKTIIEVDAGSTSKAEQIRELVDKAKYRGFGENPIRVYILNEVQALSKAAWDAMLDIMENPPQHVYFILTTTESPKVPKAVKTRCASYELKPLSKKAINDLIDMVMDEADMDIPDEFLDVVADKCEGSPRQCIQMLLKAESAKNRSELNTLLDEAESDNQIIDLARTLAFTKGKKWGKVQTILKDLKDTPPESIRIVVTTYIAGCMLNAKTEADAERLHHILDAFSTPCNSTDKLAPILLACGDICFGE